MTNLPRAGKEFFSWTFTGLPDGTTAEVNIGGDWHALTMVGQVGKILLAGPDAADASGAVVVAADQQVQVRVTDTPEVIIRGGGRIALTTE